MGKLLAEGDKAPSFRALSDAGETLSHSDFSNKRIVLYFYPKAMTPGCTKQACGLRDAAVSLKKLNAVAIGISPDKPESLAKFRDQEGLNFPLLSDPDHKIAEAFGVWQMKKNYGKEYMGVVRTTFIIEGNKIAHVMARVNTATHHDDVVKILSEK